MKTSKGRKEEGNGPRRIVWAQIKLPPETMICPVRLEGWRREANYGCLSYSTSFSITIHIWIDFLVRAKELINHGGHHLLCLYINFVFHTRRKPSTLFCICHNLDFVFLKGIMRLITVPYLHFFIYIFTILLYPLLSKDPTTFKLSFLILLSHLISCKSTLNLGNII